MAKAGIYIALFLISFNGGAMMVDHYGVADDLRLSADPNNPEEIEAAKEQSRDFSAGRGSQSTLFGLYGSLAGLLEKIFNAIMPGAAMLKRAGAPDFYVHFAFTLAPLVSAIDIWAYLRGVDLL